MLPYLSYKSYMQELYKEALFSIPVNLEFGCPNRDKEGRGGCSFCPEHGARAAQIADAKSVEEQIQKALLFAKKRYNANAFALYIQAYTGSFASLATQKKAYAKLLAHYPFKALHIGTRPDCLSEATLNYLQELNLSVDVAVELGVQSLHDASLTRMNRGHDGACSLEAIRSLKAKGLKVYAHLIIGLPDEMPSMWLETLKGVVNAGVDGIKFHHLHVIEHTALAEEYQAKPFTLLDEYAYAEALIELLRHVPSHIPILRLATDTPDKELIAPKWSMAKGQFAEYVAQTMRYRGIVQGDKCENISIALPKALKTVVLEDGSVSAWSERYHDYYHPKAGAYVQANALFLAYSKLKERLEKGDVKALDIGFGMGYNTYGALKLAYEIGHHKLYMTAMDQDRMLLLKSQQIVPDGLHQKLLQTLFESAFYSDDACEVAFINQEARYGVTLLEASFDVIFLDPFLESNNASLVSVEFFTRLKKLLKPDGVLVASTTLNASVVGLNQAGFDAHIISVAASDVRGAVAILASPACVQEGEPYRDPFGTYSDKQIETLHQKVSK